MMQKPDVDQIDGLSPAISIEQKTTSRNPRSTVGTVTEIYDYMRLLFARVGMPYSPATGLPIESQTVSQMVDRVLALPEGTRLYLLAPIVRGRKGEYKKELAELQKKGFQRVKVDGDVLRDRRRPGARQEVQARHRRGGRPHRRARRHGARLADSFETALKLADGIASPSSPTSRCWRHRRRRRQQANERTSACCSRKNSPARFRLHHRRDRAAPVLVQQPVRRLPVLRRPRLQQKIDPT
jgi:excinuclease UvrABC ATPase subunit